MHRPINIVQQSSFTSKKQPGIARRPGIARQV